MQTSIHETGFTTSINGKRHGFSILDCFVISYLCTHAEDVGGIAPVPAKMLIDEASCVFKNIENLDEHIEETKEDLDSLDLIMVREVKDEIYIFPTKECIYVGARLRKYVNKHAPIVIVSVPLIQSDSLYSWNANK